MTLCECGHGKHIHAPDFTPSFSFTDAPLGTDFGNGRTVRPIEKACPEEGCACQGFTPPPGIFERLRQIVLRQLDLVLRRME